MSEPREDLRDFLRSKRRREQPPTKLTHFQWWLCFWLAMLVMTNTGSKSKVTVYVDGKQVETTR